jgi:hypothetical protein
MHHQWIVPASCQYPLRAGSTTVRAEFGRSRVAGACRYDQTLRLGYGISPAIAPIGPLPFMAQDRFPHEIDETGRQAYCAVLLRLVIAP